MARPPADGIVNLDGVRFLLDEERVAGVLRAVPLVASGAVRVVGVSLDRIWAKPGRHFHCSYHLALDTERGRHDTRASASLLRGDRAPRDVLERAVDGPPAPEAAGHWDARRSTAVLETPGMLVQLFPWDHRLPTLPLALDARQVAAALGSAPLRECAVAGYWPGIRCQIRYRDRRGDDVLYGKVSPDESGAAVGRNQAAIGDALRAEGGVAVPRVRGHLPRLNLLLTEPLGGDPLPPSSRDVDGATMCRVAGALATFHALEVPQITRQFRPADDLALVQSWVAFASALFPDLATDLGPALDALERFVPAEPSRSTALVHRDFYDKQVLVGAAAIGLLDLDTACRGDGEIDVGNFSAHLVLRALQAGVAPDAGRTMDEAFVAAYLARRPGTDPRRLAWYRAAALLRLACVYALRPWWRTLSPRLAEASHGPWIV